MAYIYELYRRLSPEYDWTRQGFYATKAEAIVAQIVTWTTTSSDDIEWKITQRRAVFEDGNVFVLNKVNLGPRRRVQL